MNSHGEAGKCRSLAVYCHYAAGICGAGDGIFGVGGAGAGAIWFSAYFLEGRTKTMDDWRSTLVPAAVPVLVFLGLIVLQPDLGTGVACAGIAACILFVAGMRMRYFGYAFAASLLPLYFLIFHVSFR